MNSRNKKAFTLMEALIGMFVFSWMLSLYVPGYIHHIKSFKNNQLETLKWQNFHHLVQLSMTKQEAEDTLIVIDEAITLLNSTQENKVVTFSWEGQHYSISFSDGSELSVEIEAIYPY